MTEPGGSPVTDKIYIMNALSLSFFAAVAAANPECFTVNAFTGEIPVTGYCVALQETQNSFNNEGLQNVLKVIESGKTRAAFVGGWLDHETGLYYYDATIVTDNLKDALTLAKANKQIAIFCLDTFEEIRL